MNDFLFEILKLAVMAAALLITRYAVPWIKEKTDAGRVAVIAEWASKAVLSAQQVLTSATGAEKKAIVTDFLKEILEDKKIALSDAQLDVLIEAAVKQMKIYEPSELLAVGFGETEGK